MNDTPETISIKTDDGCTIFTNCRFFDGAGREITPEEQFSELIAAGIDVKYIPETEPC